MKVLKVIIYILELIIGQAHMLLSMVIFRLSTVRWMRVDLVCPMWELDLRLVA